MVQSCREWHVDRILGEFPLCPLKQMQIADSWPRQTHIKFLTIFIENIDEQ